MIEILSSRVYYRNPDGGVTRRVTEHFWKRTVTYRENGEEKRIDILNNELGISVTIEEIKSYIMSQ